jgi:hypothetical protein
MSYLVIYHVIPCVIGLFRPSFNKVGRGKKGQGKVKYVFLQDFGDSFAVRCRPIAKMYLTTPVDPTVNVLASKRPKVVSAEISAESENENSCFTYIFIQNGKQLYFLIFRV